MSRLLENKVAIVTGASRGLGFAIATALGVDGAKVFLVARNEEKLAEAQAKVERGGTEAASFAADLLDPEAPTRIVDGALSRFGRLDILVNNAGVFVWKKFFDLSREDWQRTVGTNLTAPFLLTWEAARVMAGIPEGEGPGGAIVNIASVHGSVPEGNVVPQCASKAGLIGLTRAAADALRPYRIRVNAIAPGAIEPESFDRRGESPERKVTQADIATLVVYLVSDLARTITGAVVDMLGSTRTVIRI